jgi:aerobic carbon-monoxide dehydrogenase medium subunit
MATAPFEYLSTTSYDEAVQALAESGEDAKILAGGQSLVPMMNLRLVRPSVLIDINHADARPPSLEGAVLRLSALTRHRELLENPLVRRHCPLLPAAVWHVGNVRVRNRGTIGGSLAHADPTSEIGASALVLGARVVATGPGGSRTLSAGELFVTYLTTSLGADELLTDVLVPIARNRQGHSFQEVVRRTSDLAIVAVAARVDLDEAADVVVSADVSLAGVADRVDLAASDLLEELVGSSADDATIARVAAAVADSVRTQSDVHASAVYRKRLVEVLTRRAIREAFDRAIVATGGP